VQATLCSLKDWVMDTGRFKDWAVDTSSLKDWTVDTGSLNDWVVERELTIYFRPHQFHCL